MSIVKFDANSLLRRQETLSRKRLYRDRLAILKDHKDDIFWRTLRDQLRIIIKGAGLKVENELGHDSADPLAEFANCKYNQGAMQCAEEIIASVDGAEALRDKAMEDIAALEQEIKNIKEKEHFNAEENASAD